VYSGLGVGSRELAAAGTRTTTVPSCPRRPGCATVSVVITDPVYVEVTVVNKGFGGFDVGVGVAADEGTRTITVPSWPRGPGCAAVSVVTTAPVYTEVIVVYNGFASIGVGAREAAEEGTRTITVPSCPREFGGAAVSVVTTVPVYAEVIVVYNPETADAGVGVAAADEGTLTMTVPSCPRRPGCAAVSVVITDPVYTEVIVVYDGFRSGTDATGGSDTLKGKETLEGKATNELSAGRPVDRTAPDGRALIWDSKELSPGIPDGKTLDGRAATSENSELSAGTLDGRTPGGKDVTMALISERSELSADPPDGSTPDGKRLEGKIPDGREVTPALISDSSEPRLDAPMFEGNEMPEGSEDMPKF
jgi:hypothetical protein